MYGNRFNKLIFALVEYYNRKYQINVSIFKIFPFAKM